MVGTVVRAAVRPTTRPMCPAGSRSSCLSAEPTRSISGAVASGDNGMVTDRLTVGGDRVHLSDVRVPFLTVLATPVDFRHMGSLADLFRVGGLEVSDVLDADGNVPPRVVVQGFRALTPTSEVTRYVTLWERLWNDEYVAGYRP